MALGENCEKWQNGGKCWMSNLWSMKRRGQEEGEEEVVIYSAYTNTNTITCGYGYEHTHYELWNIHKKCLCKHRLHLVTSLLLSSDSPCSPPPLCLADFHSSNWISLHVLCHFSLWFWFGFFFLADCIFDSQSGPKMCQIVNNIWNDLIPY